MTDIVFEGTGGATEAGAGAVNGRLGTAHDGDRIAAGGGTRRAGLGLSRGRTAGDDKAVYSGESVTLSDPGHKVDRRPVGGPSSGGMHALFGRRTLEGLAANDDGDDLERRRLEATLGYGMGMFGDGFTGTPELGVVLSDTDREYRVGWRLGLVRREDVDFDLSLDATRHEPADDDREPSQRIGLGLNAWW